MSGMSEAAELQRVAAEIRDRIAGRPAYQRTVILSLALGYDIASAVFPHDPALVMQKLLRGVEEHAAVHHLELNQALENASRKPL